MGRGLMTQKVPELLRGQNSRESRVEAEVGHNEDGFLDSLRQASMEVWLEQLIHSNKVVSFVF